MGNSDHFEENIKDILNADDSAENEGKPTKSNFITNSDKNTKSDYLKQYSTKKTPLWLAILVKTLAGGTALFLLIRYAMNIAYR